MSVEEVNGVDDLAHTDNRAEKKGGGGK